MLIFTSENFEKEVLQSDKPVLVDFFCHLVRPVQGYASGSGRA